MLIIELGLVVLSFFLPKRKWVTRTRVGAVFVFMLFLIPAPFSLHAENIDPDNDGSQYAQFTVVDRDNDGTPDRINFEPNGGGVTVSASGTTGYAWGESIGWINTNPDGGNVSLSCSNGVGTFSGYWWSNSGGGSWINLDPAGGGLTLTADGEFSGNIWVENSGWVEFTCPGTYTCVKTSYTCSGSTPSAGITISESGGFTLVSETGTTDTFTVVLDAQPSSDVVVSITSGDTGEATVSPSTLTFTNGNWNTPQTVTVTGVDDTDKDGNQSIGVSISVVDGSSDDTYDSVGDKTVYVIVEDNESGDITSGSHPECSDGLDNGDSEDVLADVLDPGCHSDGNPNNIASYDSADTNETDTVSSCSYFTPWLCPVYECSDNIDNDGDGFIDYPSDSGCDSGTDTSESNQTPTYQCSDRIDNDNDGKTDYPNDPGCDSQTDDSEYALCLDNPTHQLCVTSYACSDGIDNNDTEDTLADSADPGCHTDGDAGNQSSYNPQDSSELDTTSPTYQCSDGIDNDNDGRIDYPSDSGCDSGTDDQESLPLCVEFPNNSACLPTIVTTTETIVDEVKTVFGTLQKTSFPLVARIIALAALATSLPGLGVRVGNALLGFLGYRKRRKPWGVVYDALTKQPLDPAYVRLLDQKGKEIGTAITDLDGRFTFLADPGTYMLTAEKTNYLFPSKILKGKSSDELYQNLYFGGPITVSQSGEVIVRNIPMDPVGTNWNEETKKKMSIFTFFTRADIVTTRIINILFGVGLVFSVIALILSPVLFNIIIVSAYGCIILLEFFGFAPVVPGIVRDAFGRPLQNAIIRVWDPELRYEISHRVTDERGQYYILIAKGHYRITIDKRNPNGTYTRSYTSGEIYTRRGLINAAIQIQ